MDRRSFFSTLIACLIGPFLSHKLVTKRNKVCYGLQSVGISPTWNTKQDYDLKVYEHSPSRETVEKLRKILTEYNNGGVLEIIWSDK